MGELAGDSTWKIEGKMDVPKPTKNNNLLEYARTLRHEMTRHERKLWYDFLRYYPVKIYKQRIIESYIVDFYCASAKLVIELDGSQHFTEEGQVYDNERTFNLSKYGLTVIRFSNYEVDTEFDAICKAIDIEIKAKTEEKA